MPIRFASAPISEPPLRRGNSRVERSRRAGNASLFVHVGSACGGANLLIILEPKQTRVGDEIVCSPHPYGRAMISSTLSVTCAAVWINLQLCFAELGIAVAECPG